MSFYDGFLLGMEWTTKISLSHLGYALGFIISVILGGLVILTVVFVFHCLKNLILLVLKKR
jgi:hypothetical protein